MNLLTISDIKLAGQPIKIADFADYLKGRFADANIKCEMKTKKDVIEIIQNSEKKLFMSTKENIHKLKEDDPLIKKNGRDYLKSQRLSERQYKELIKVFSLHLDQICVSCSVKL